VLSDPVVGAAMDTAWANSDEGTANEHEEGFLIYQCRTQTANGIRYTTEVDFGVGTVSSLQFPPRRADPNCRLVATHHTHPGVGLNNPLSNDPYANDQPSAQDLSIGLPGIITYGLGPSRGVNTIEITYGPSVNPNLAWTCPVAPVRPNPRPVSYNDPHLITFDGLGYDFQAAGEFVLAQAEVDGFVVQSRQQPWGRSGSQVSANSALAFLVEEDEVALQFDSTQSLRIFVNGEQLMERGNVALPSGGVLTIDSGTISILWLDQSNALIRVRSGFLNLSLALADRLSNSVFGLLGNFDGEPENDLQTNTGIDLTSRPTAENLYGIFADGWRVTDDTSLFVYLDGESTETFTDRLFPGRVVTVADLDEDVVEEATMVCQNQGITNRFLLNNCILDVGITNDLEFANAAAELANEVVDDIAMVEVQGQINVPSQVCINPVLFDANGAEAPPLAGRYIGLLTNPDARTTWDNELEMSQCGVELTGIQKSTAQRANALEYYRRFSGQWSGGQLMLEFSFPFNYESTAEFTPCTNVTAVLDVIGNQLRGPWMSDNCFLGGEIDVTRP